MTSARQDRLARVRQAVDGVHADPVRITPMQAASQYKPAGPDTNRAAFDAAGPLAIGTGDDETLAGDARTGWTARIPVGQAELSIDPVTYPLVLTVKKGDLVSAPDRQPPLSFEVVRVDRGQVTRRVLRLAFK